MFSEIIGGLSFQQHQWASSCPMVLKHHVDAPKIRPRGPPTLALHSTLVATQPWQAPSLDQCQRSCEVLRRSTYRAFSSPISGRDMGREDEIRAI